MKYPSRALVASLLVLSCGTQEESRSPKPPEKPTPTATPTIGIPLSETPIPTPIPTTVPTEITPTNEPVVDENQPGNLRVAVVSDIHPGQSERSPVLAESLARTVHGDPGFWGTFFLGDVTNGATDSEWDVFTSMFKETFLRPNQRLVTGNHDFVSALHGSCCSGSIAASRLEGFKPYWAERLGNTWTVFLDTGRLTNDLGDEQWAFLESELARGADLERLGKVDWTVVAMHQVLVSAGTKREDGNMIAMRPRFANLFKKYGVDVVMGGHQHVAQATVLDGTLFLVTPSGGGVLYNNYQPSLKSFRPGNDFTVKEFTPELYYSLYGFLDLRFGKSELRYELKDADATPLYTFTYDNAAKRIVSPRTVTVNVCVKNQVNMNLLLRRKNAGENADEIRVPMYRNEKLGKCWFTQKAQLMASELHFALDNHAMVDMSAVNAPAYRSPEFSTTNSEVFIYKDEMRTTSYFSHAERDGLLETDEIRFESAATEAEPLLKLLRNDATKIEAEFWCDQDGQKVKLGERHVAGLDAKYVLYRIPRPDCPNLVYAVKVFDGAAEFQPSLPGQGHFIQRQPETVRLVELLPATGARNVSPATTVAFRLSRAIDANLPELLSLRDPDGNVAKGQWEIVPEGNDGKSIRYEFRPDRRLRKGTEYRLVGMPRTITTHRIAFRTRMASSNHGPIVDGTISPTEGYAYRLDDAADNPWGRHGDFDALHLTWNESGVFVGVQASLFKNDLTLVFAGREATLARCLETGSALSRPHRFESTTDMGFKLLVTLDGNGITKVARPGTSAENTCGTAQVVPAESMGIVVKNDSSRMGHLEVFIPWAQISTTPLAFGIKGIVTTGRGEYAYGDSIPSNTPRATGGKLDAFLELDPDEDRDGLIDLL